MQRLPIHAQQIERCAAEDEGDFGFDFWEGVQRLRVQIWSLDLLPPDDAAVSVVRA